VLTIQPMSLLDVRRDWGWIRNGLLEIIGRCKERWEPEDVWTAAMSNAAFIWRINYEHDDIGFMVIRRDLDVDGAALFVWALWVEPDSIRYCYKDLMARIDDVARRVGAKRIRMESPREGWNWVKLFTPVRTIYERELNEA
jgi:hypothetical protein